MPTYYHGTQTDILASETTYLDPERAGRVTTGPDGSRIITYRKDADDPDRPHVYLSDDKLASELFALPAAAKQVVAGSFDGRFPHVIYETKPLFGEQGFLHTIDIPESVEIERRGNGKFVSYEAIPVSDATVTRVTPNELFGRPDPVHPYYLDDASQIGTFGAQYREVAQQGLEETQRFLSERVAAGQLHEVSTADLSFSQENATVSAEVKATLLVTQDPTLHPLKGLYLIRYGRDVPGADHAASILDPPADMSAASATTSNDAYVQHILEKLESFSPLDRSRMAINKDFARDYIGLRQATEEPLREAAEAKGIVPESSQPLYFILHSDPNPNPSLMPGKIVVAIPAENVPAHLVSFTADDSFYNFPVQSVELPDADHGKVFNGQEMGDVLQRRGWLPSTPNKPRFYEAQLWSRRIEDFVPATKPSDTHLNAGLLKTSAQTLTETELTTTPGYSENGQTRSRVTPNASENVPRGMHFPVEIFDTFSSAATDLFAGSPADMSRPAEVNAAALRFSLQETRDLVVGAFTEYHPSLGARAARIFDAGFIPDSPDARASSNTGTIWLNREAFFGDPSVQKADAEDLARLPDGQRWRIVETQADAPNFMMRSLPAESPAMNGNPVNPHPYSVIDFQFDGTLNHAVYVAHEVTHSIADDLTREKLGIREPTGKSIRSFDANPRYMDETQAYFGQNILYDHIARHPELELTHPGITAGAADHRENIFSKAVRDLATADDRARATLEAGGAESTLVSQRDSLHSRPMGILASSAVLQATKGQDAQARGAIVRSILGGEGPANIEDVLRIANVQTLEDLQNLAASTVKHSTVKRVIAHTPDRAAEQTAGRSTHHHSAESSVNRQPVPPLEAPADVKPVTGSPAASVSENSEGTSRPFAVQTLNDENLSFGGKLSPANPAMQAWNGKLGIAAVGINLVDAIVKKDPRKAAAVGITTLGLHGGMKVVGKIAGAEAIPVVGEMVGGVFAGKDAYEAATSGHTTRAAISGAEATLYAISAGASAVALADCWNPTVIAPAAVAVIAGGAAVTITAAKGLYDNWHTVKDWFASEPHAKPVQSPPTENRVPRDFASLRAPDLLRVGSRLALAPSAALSAPEAGDVGYRPPKTQTASSKPRRHVPMVYEAP